MEKAILKTLIYADIFDYPLKVNEIHKWLIGRKAGLRQVEKALKVHQEYYFLPKRAGLVAKRKLRKKNSAIYMLKAKMIAQILRIIPWVKLVGVSGGLALSNASKKDDIDFFIITAKKRLWLSRFFILGLLSVLGTRRKKDQKEVRIAGKVCVNILLEEDKLEQKNKDIYVAHEVLQMRPIWERNGIYGKYLEDNVWVFKFLPNWVGGVSAPGTEGAPGTKKTRTSLSFNNSFIDKIENLAKDFQLSIMKKPKGAERIEDGSLYFHPNDCRKEVLKKYAQKLKKLAPLDK